MAHHPGYVERMFMDDRSHRSQPPSPNGYMSLAQDRQTPRYLPLSGSYDDRRADYFSTVYGHGYEGRSHDRGFHGYDGDSRWGSDERVRSANRQAAIANSCIEQPALGAQLHPMMTSDGRYPTSFRLPRRLEEFLYMSHHELDRIMMAYELGASRQRYYRGNLADRFGNDDMFRSSNSERRRDLIALFEFLGAYRLVEHLRRGR